VTSAKSGRTEESELRNPAGHGSATNVDGFGTLEAADPVALTDRKAIGVTDYMLTNVDHITPSVSHRVAAMAQVAEAQGRGASRNHRAEQIILLWW